MRCFRCGKRLRSSAFYCSRCGNPVRNSPGAARSSGVPGRPSLALSVGVLIAALVLLGGGGFYAYQLFSEPSQPTEPYGLVARPLGVEPTSRLVTGLGATAVAQQAVPRPSSQTTAGAAQTTTTTAPPTTETTQAPEVQAFMEVAGALAATLSDYDDRLARLSDTIDSTAPDVPPEVFDQLEQMMEQVRAERRALTRAVPPAGYEEAKQSLARAGLSLTEKAQSILTGILAMDRTGREASADEAFAKAGESGEEFKSAFATYEERIAAFE